jgi:hypothetical protein
MCPVWIVLRILAIGLPIGGLGILALRYGRGETRRAELGWMSQQWLAEHRAGNPDGL